MPTFAESYCARTGCPPEKFRRRVFWRTLHWHALPFAPLLLLGDYFESDYSLIGACGRESRMREIFDETRDFPYNPQNSSWLHRHANLRVSTRRLRQLAAPFLAEAPPAIEPPGAAARGEAGHRVGHHPMGPAGLLR